MPRFRQTKEILEVMDKKERIRNVGVVAHIDHGKTTMTDSLLADAGLLPSQVAGSARALDYLEEEQRRGITIKTANISLLHELDGQAYVVNLIDTPGHVDFTGKVARALRATDGVVVVVDAVEEVMAQTETVIRQALDERVKPVLFVNKMDRLVKELKLGADEIQKKLSRIVSQFNDLIDLYAEPEFREKWKVNYAEGSVAFGSALHRWGFTLDQAERKMVRSADIVEAYIGDEYRSLPKQIPLAHTILEMVVRSLPSPVEAQKYRIPKIWKGDTRSEIGKAMLNCDSGGPTVMFIINSLVDPNAGVVATGRVFSGSVEEGKKVHLMTVNKDYDLKQVSLCMSQFRETVTQITAGNIAALTGLDLTRAGETLVVAAYQHVMVPFESVRYVSEPVVTIAVEPKNPEDLPKLREALGKLAIQDPNLTVTIQERTGEHLISGLGELHLETAMTVLKEFSSGMELTVSEPSADYRETVTARGSAVVAKTSNEKNSFRIQAEPQKAISSQPTTKSIGEVWASDEHGNTFVNISENMERLNDIKDMAVDGFSWACKTGPLAEQPLKDVKAKLLEAQISDNPAFCDRTQITRAVSRAILGSFLTARPVLLEPIYRIEAFTPTEWFGKCAELITRRRGKIRKTESRGGQTIITGFIPVSETFGLAAEMRSATSGHAFWQCTFDHWERMPEGLAAETIRRIRVRRGLPPEVPEPEKFVELI